MIHGDNADVLPTLPDGGFQLIYVDPPFNTGTVQQRRTLRTVRDDEGDRTGFQGQRYRTVDLGRLGYSDVHDDLPGLHRRPADAGAPAARRGRHALLPHRLPRGALLQGAAGFDLRPRLLPQRGHLGLRLRRPREGPVAGQARQHPGVREAAEEALLRPGPDRADPVPGTGAGGAEKAARGKLPTDVCGTPSCPPTAGRRPAIRRKSR